MDPDPAYPTEIAADAIRRRLAAEIRERRNPRKETARDLIGAISLLDRSIDRESVRHQRGMKAAWKVVFRLLDWPFRESQHGTRHWMNRPPLVLEDQPDETITASGRESVSSPLHPESHAVTSDFERAASPSRVSTSAGQRAAKRTYPSGKSHTMSQGHDQGQRQDQGQGQGQSGDREVGQKVGDLTFPHLGESRGPLSFSSNRADALQPFIERLRESASKGSGRGKLMLELFEREEDKIEYLQHAFARGGTQRTSGSVVDLRERLRPGRRYPFQPGPPTKDDREVVYRRDSLPNESSKGFEWRTLSRERSSEVERPTGVVEPLDALPPPEEFRDNREVSLEFEQLEPPSLNFLLAGDEAAAAAKMLTLGEGYEQARTAGAKGTFSEWRKGYVERARRPEDN